MVYRHPEAEDDEEDDEEQVPDVPSLPNAAAKGKGHADDDIYMNGQ
jgi:hypothetical protein